MSFSITGNRPTPIRPMSDAAAALPKARVARQASAAVNAVGKARASIARILSRLIARGAELPKETRTAHDRLVDEISLARSALQTRI